MHDQDPPSLPARGRRALATTDGHGIGGRAATRRHTPHVPFVAGLGAAYLLVSVAMWWNVWGTGHPASTTTCVCGDPAQTAWFLGATAFAIAHGHSLFLSSLVSYPSGVNLLANNSVLLIGALLAPVTWVFGPLAALNVAVTLVPVANALAGYALCRRFASRWPSAAGGLLFGFSPFVVGNLPYGHLSTSLLAFPALTLVCLYELLVRQKGSPGHWGIALAATVVAEFFVSTEMLAAEGLVVALLVVVGLLVEIARRSPDLGARIRWAAPGLLAGAGASGAVLAAPAWFALAGPRHVSGAIWSFTAAFGNAWNGFFFVPTGSGHSSAFTRFGGYLGPVGPPASYFGIPLLAVLAAGLALFRKVRVLWWAAGTVVVTAVLSLGADLVPYSWYSSWPLPWRLAAHVPVVENIGPGRLVAFSYAGAAIMVAVIVDRLWNGGGQFMSRRPHALSVENGPRAGTSYRNKAAVRRHVLAIAAGAVAIIPLAQSYSSVPYVTTRRGEPTWFTRQAPHLPTSSVLLTLPYPSGRVPDAMDWQAMGGMHYSLVGAYAKVPGSNGQVDYTGRPGSADEILSSLTTDIGPLPAATPANLAVVRHALAQRHVSAAVVAGETRSPSYAAGFLTAVLGRTPRYSGGVWYWKHIGTPLSTASLQLPRGVLTACVLDALPKPSAHEAVPDCVMAHAIGAPTAGGSRALASSGRAPGA